MSEKGTALTYELSCCWEGGSGPFPTPHVVVFDRGSAAVVIRGCHKEFPLPVEDIRLLLIDLENSIGVRPRPRMLRARLDALLTTAGAVHHAVAGYAVADFADDLTASVLAELSVAPLRVSPAPDAAELVLLAHARRVHDTLGCRSFLVAFPGCP